MVGDAEFIVDDRDCDVIAKEEFVEIYVRKRATGLDSPLSPLRNRRVLLLRYDPWSWDSPLPSITASGTHEIAISVPRVSEVIAEQRNWRGLSIKYDIGHIEYP